MLVDLVAASSGGGIISSGSIYSASSETRVPSCKSDSIPFKMHSLLALLTSLAAVASALGPAGWRKQSVYQVVTDRFARTDGSTSASCDPYEDGGIYCNGTWTGLINHLDYIQNMGFTAVSTIVAI